MEREARELSREALANRWVVVVHDDDRVVVRLAAALLDADGARRFERGQERLALEIGQARERVGELPEIGAHPYFGMAAVVLQEHVERGLLRFADDRRRRIELRFREVEILRLAIP